MGEHLKNVITVTNLQLASVRIATTPHLTDFHCAEIVTKKDQQRRLLNTRSLILSMRHIHARLTDVNQKLVILSVGIVTTRINKLPTCIWYLHVSHVDIEEMEILSFVGNVSKN
jgi:hypothetical protein